MSEETQEEFDYVSKKFLDELEDAQERVLNCLEDDPEKIILINRPLPKYTKGNYCALHLLVEFVEDASKPVTSELRWTRPFEHQHIGPRVDKGKKLDDKWFKFKSGKEIGEEYSELKRPWEVLMADENAAAKEEYIRYAKDANLRLRIDEMQEEKTKKLVNRNGNLYITPRDYNLTPEYDLNVQYNVMLECEKRAKRQKEAVKKQAESNTSKSAEMEKSSENKKENNKTEKIAKIIPITELSKPVELKKTISPKARVKKEVNVERLITQEEIQKLIEKFGGKQKHKKLSRINPSLKTS